MTFAWTLDERKFLTLAFDKVRQLRKHCGRKKAGALGRREFLGVRDGRFCACGNVILKTSPKKLLKD